VRHGTQSHYFVHMVPITRPGGEIPYVIEMSTDITPVKQLEHEKREAERLAAVGETVAGIAHGIKNVLMGLEGGMYAVNTGIEHGDDERIARGWQMLEENVTRISQFVREFLDFAKGRVAQVAMVDPNAPVRKVVELFGEKAAQAGIRLAVDLGKGIPVVIVTAVTGYGGDKCGYKKSISHSRLVPPPEGYFPKPIDREEFLGTIQKLLA